MAWLRHSLWIARTTPVHVLRVLSFWFTIFNCGFPIIEDEETAGIEAVARKPPDHAFQSGNLVQDDRDLFGDTGVAYAIIQKAGQRILKLSACFEVTAKVFVLKEILLLLHIPHL